MKLFLLLYSFTLSIFSQNYLEISSGVIYPESSFLKSSDTGLQLETPKGYNAAISDELGLLIIEAFDRKTRIFISVEELTETEVEKTLSENIAIGDGILLIPESDFKKEGSTLENRFSLDFEGQELESYIIAKAVNSNRYVSTIMITNSDHYEKQLETLKELSKSISSFKVKENLEQPSTLNWNEYLKGKHLVNMKTSSGYTEKTDIWLCSNGQFRFKDEASSLSVNGTGAYAGKNAGTWRTEGNRLLLSYNDDKTRSYELKIENDKLFLNGYRYFRDSNELCD
jgi:hypothetical protein